ncbi:hypothetical protein D3C78_1125610 [compost metagenome]
MLARYLKLQADIFANRLQGLLIGAQRLQWRQPDVENIFQHRQIQGFFGGEVIQQIGFGHVGTFCHLVQTSAMNTVQRKKLQCRIQDCATFCGYRTRAARRGFNGLWLHYGSLAQPDFGQHNKAIG